MEPTYICVFLFSCYHFSLSLKGTGINNGCLRKKSAKKKKEKPHHDQEVHLDSV